MSWTQTSTHRAKGEPTLPLINIVFLMLIFFLVAAQVARPLDSALELVQTDDPRVVPPPDALVLMQDGSVQFRGQTSSAQDAYRILSAELGEVVNMRILPDSRSQARDLILLAAQMRDAGAQNVFVVTERALQ